MNTLGQAMRNVLRHHRRSRGPVFVLAVSLAVILLFGGYRLNIQYSLLTDYVRGGGHLQVQHQDHFMLGTSDVTTSGIQDYKLLIDLIKSDKLLSSLVTVVTPTLEFSAIASNYDFGLWRSVAVVGYVAEDVAQLRRWNEFGISGELSVVKLQGTPPDTAIVGAALAQALALCEPLALKDCRRVDAKIQTGTRNTQVAGIQSASQMEQADRTLRTHFGRADIELLAGEVVGSPNVTTLHVLAAEDQGLKESDSARIALHLRAAQELVYKNKLPQATAIVIQLAQSQQLPIAVTRLGELLTKPTLKQPLVVLDFQFLNPTYARTLQLFDSILGFVFILIGSIVLVTVNSAMNVAVLERTIEIGTMRVIGFTRRDVRNLFMVEGFLLGCIGTGIGLCIALIAAFTLNRFQLTWLPPGGLNRLSLNVSVWGEMRMIAGATGALILLSLLSTWLPARRAAGLNIVDAMRNA